MKDFLISLEFRFIDSKSDGDWFGLMLRAPEGLPFTNGILVNSRWNGGTELTLYPNGSIPATKKLYKANNEFKLMQIEIENEQIVVTNKSGDENGILKYENLSNVNFGKIFIIAYNSHVEWKKLKIVCRDTIMPTW